MEELSAEKLSAKYHEKVRKNQVEPEIPLQENVDKDHVRTSRSISEDLLRRRVTFSSLQVNSLQVMHFLYILVIF